MTTRESGELRIEHAGIELILLPERALWIPSFDAVLVADLHWGKAAAFRAAQVPVPVGTTASDLSRLSQVLERTAARQLVVLGDLLHARAGRSVHTFGTIAAWRERHRDVTMLLVRGNHDDAAGDPPPELGIHCTDLAWRAGPFVGIHEPEPSTEGYVIGGHLHPHVTLRGRGRSHTRLPAFVFGPTRAVLPAFSAFTGGGMYEPRAGDALYLIADDEVMAVP